MPRSPSLLLFTAFPLERRTLAHVLLGDVSSPYDRSIVRAGQVLPDHVAVHLNRPGIETDPHVSTDLISQAQIPGGTNTDRHGISVDVQGPPSRWLPSLVADRSRGDILDRQVSGNARAVDPETGRTLNRHIPCNRSVGEGQVPADIGIKSGLRTITWPERTSSDS